MNKPVGILLALVLSCGLVACGDGGGGSKQPSAPAKKESVDGPIQKEAKDYYAGLVFWKVSDCHLKDMPVYYVLGKDTPLKRNTENDSAVVFDFIIHMDHENFYYAYIEHELRLREDGTEESVEVFNEHGQEKYEILDDGRIRLGKWGHGGRSSFRSDQIIMDFTNAERPELAGKRALLQFERSQDATISEEYKAQVCPAQ